MKEDRFACPFFCAGIRCAKTMHADCDYRHNVTAGIIRRTDAETPRIKRSDERQETPLAEIISGNADAEPAKACIYKMI